MFNFLEMYFNVMADYPVSIFVATLCALAIVLHIALPMYYLIKNLLVGFWTRGKIETVDKYLLFVEKTLYKAEFNKRFEIKHVSQIPESRHSSDLTLTDGFVLVCVGFDDYISKYRINFSDSSGNYTLKDSMVFDSVEDIKKHFYRNYSQSYSYMTQLLGLLATTVSLVSVSVGLDILITNYPVLLVSVLTLVAVVFGVLFGGRAMFDVTEKFKTLEEVIKKDK